MRVHKIARTAGVMSHEVLTVARGVGLPFKSASSDVPPVLAGLLIDRMRWNQLCDCTGIDTRTPCPDKAVPFTDKCVDCTRNCTTAEFAAERVHYERTHKIATSEQCLTGDKCRHDAPWKP